MLPFFPLSPDWIAIFWSIFLDHISANKIDLFAQPQFLHYASLEILEECGIYKKAQLYRKKDCTSVIVLHFRDGDEYEGLGGEYLMTEDNKILDPDGDEIYFRNLVKVNTDDSHATISECEVIAANAKFGEKKLPSSFFRRHSIVRESVCLTRQSFLCMYVCLQLQVEPCCCVHVLFPAVSQYMLAEVLDMNDAETNNRSEGDVISSMLIAAWGKSGRFFIPTIDFNQSGDYLICYSLVAPKCASDEIVGRVKKQKKSKRRTYNSLSAPNPEIVNHLEKHDMQFVSETLLFHVTVVPSPILEACQSDHSAIEEIDDFEAPGEESRACVSDTHLDPAKVIARRPAHPNLSHATT